MDYGSLISKTWQTVSGKRFLLMLGILAVIAPGAGVVGADFIIEPLLNPNFDQMINMQMRQTPGIDPSQLQLIGEMLRLVLVGIGCSILVVGVILWVNSRISEGGLIASVRQIASNQPAGFALGWMSGVRKATQLIVIGLVLLIPNFVLSVALYLLNALLLAQTSPQSIGLSGEPDPGASLAVLGLACANLALFIPLYLVRTLAERACVLENRLVGASFQRGLEMLRTQPGPVLMVFLIEIGVRLTVGLVLAGLLCGILFAVALMGGATQSTQGISNLTSVMLCCLTPPVLVVGGIMQSYSSGLWTLAWLGWASPSTSDPTLLTGQPSNV